ncbi:MAG: helix-turn-helix transcriptional regulator [Eubacteriales bacterium]|nr:helix-turn-helix transcriptional regulator [Eubacteriales bacterium]
METIKILREKAGLSQAQLAEAVGVDRSAVAKWEGAGTFPRADKIPSICSTLNCTPNELFNVRPRIASCSETA